MPSAALIASRYELLVATGIISQAARREDRITRHFAIGSQGVYIGSQGFVLLLASQARHVRSQSQAVTYRETLAASNLNILSRRKSLADLTSQYQTTETLSQAEPALRCQAHPADPTCLVRSLKSQCPSLSQSAKEDRSQAASGVARSFVTVARLIHSNRKPNLRTRTVRDPNKSINRYRNCRPTKSQS